MRKSTRPAIAGKETETGSGLVTEICDGSEIKFLFCPERFTEARFTEEEYLSLFKCRGARSEVSTAMGILHRRVRDGYLRREVIAGIAYYSPVLREANHASG